MTAPVTEHVVERADAAPAGLAPRPDGDAVSALRPLDVTVTIVNWNRGALLDRCLASVLAAKGVALEVVVVDNASDDDSRAIVRERFASVRLLCNDRNLGFARAQNQAIAVAGGRYVLALNNDATVHPDTIAHLVRVLDENPDAAVCGCPDARQVTLRGARAGAFRSFPSLPGTIAENVWAVVRPPARRVDALARTLRADAAWRDRRTLEVAWVIGAVLLLRRSALDAVGSFDEGFFLFGEEVDLCRRLRTAGWKVLFAPGTQIEHVGGAGSALRGDVERLRRDAGARYFRKHHGALAGRVFTLQHWLLRERLLPWRGRVRALLATTRRAG